MADPGKRRHLPRGRLSIRVFDFVSRSQLESLPSLAASWYHSSMTKSATAPGALRRDARPPISPDSAPNPGAVAASRRRTVVPRPMLRPVKALGHTARPGSQPRSVPVTDGYVRRFWTAVIGPGAVADLLRLAAAAERGRSLLRPVHLDVLLRFGLVSCRGAIAIVSHRVPLLPPPLVRSLPPRLRREHDLRVAAML